jgi:short subunit dehydrogenase-like uncharacterized protein
MRNPSFDVIVFGATSFVGQILCRYLLSTYGAGDGKAGLRWAMAGRSEAKLQTLAHTLGDKAQAVPRLVADAADEAALTRLCAQTRVVASTVGPYALYGSPLVRACVASGTDYVDLTGEVQWIARMVREIGPAAQASGARIVHCCGFDSIPSDFGVWHLQQLAQERFGAPCTQVTMRVKAMKGGASGGTAASLVNVIKEAARDPDLRRELMNPYSICPPGYSNGTKQRNPLAPAYDKAAQAWTAPFVMAGINTRIVFRSNALLGHAYGAGFTYDEMMMTGKGMAGRAAAFALVGGLGGFMAAATLPPTRWLLEKTVLPAPGDGPSPEAQEKGHFDLRFFGKTAKGETLNTKVTGDRDPGYGSTAKMLGEAAVCLAKDISKKELAGGSWTPATAFGKKLLTRLQENAGLTFSEIP